MCEWEKWLLYTVQGPQNNIERFLSLLFKSWVALTLGVVGYSVYQSEYLAALTGVLCLVAVIFVLPVISLWAIYLFPQQLRKGAAILDRDDDSLVVAILVVVPILMVVFLWVLPLMIALSFPKPAGKLAKHLLPLPLALETRVQYILRRSNAYW